MRGGEGVGWHTVGVEKAHYVFITYRLFTFFTIPSQSPTSSPTPPSWYRMLTPPTNTLITSQEMSMDAQPLAPSNCQLDEPFDFESEYAYFELCISIFWVIGVISVQVHHIAKIIGHFRKTELDCTDIFSDSCIWNTCIDTLSCLFSLRPICFYIFI